MKEKEGIIETLEKSTFKQHIRPAAGFNSFNGALALIILFVTHYNFLRPHMSLDYNVPVPLEELKNISTIQGKWAKIISLAS
ncbi:MAG: integrase core domain-containing protein [Candidatus Firestonebacteria bacterium]